MSEQMRQNLGELVLPTPETRPDYYHAIDPMDGRYNEAEIERYFSEESKVAYQAYVEAALAHTLADFGKCSREVALEIEAACKDVSAEEVEAREKGRREFKGFATNHDLGALVDAITFRVSDEAKPWVHVSATSYDTAATAGSLQFKEGVRRLIFPRVILLGDSIAALTERYADTAQVGRTHLQHAVPITFGFATSRYLGRLGESLIEINNRANNLQGKFSGVVGGYNASKLIIQNPKEFEATLLAKLGLNICEHATQIVPAENMLRLLDELAITSGIMAQIGEDMRNLQRTEIAEVGEHFDAETQKGSTAAVQKRNPINFENAAGIHRQVLGQLFSAHLNYASDLQRDLRDSVAMRFYPLIPAIVARTALNLAKTLAKLEVNEPNMHKNLYMTDGAIAAEALQTVLRDQGYTDAYAIAKRIVNKAIEEGVTFRRMVATDDQTRPVLDILPPHQVKAVINPETDNLGLTAEEARRHVAVWEDIKLQLAA